MSARILLIDDDAGIRESMRMPLEYEGYDYLQAATAEEGIALVQREHVATSLLQHQRRPSRAGADIHDAPAQSLDGPPIDRVPIVDRCEVGAVVVAPLSVTTSLPSLTLTSCPCGSSKAG